MNSSGHKKNIFQKSAAIFGTLARTLSLMLLILLFWIERGLNALQKRFPQVKGLRRAVIRFSDTLDRPSPVPTISRLDIIQLAVKNMKQKKTRTFITIGGMTIGIATIVFLLAIGYGLQSLVVNRVARLEEMRQLDITIPPGSNLTITEGTLRDLARITDVESVAPVIALVANASYQNSSTDLVAYGVTRDYLEQSAIRPIRGEMFVQNDIVLPNPAPAQTSSTEQDSEAGAVEISLIDDAWIEVRDQSSPHAQLLGYTQESGQTIEAVPVTGEEYLINQILSDRWYRVTVLSWSEQEDSYGPDRNEAGVQRSITGYIPATSVETSTEVAEVAAGDSVTVTRKVDLPANVSNQVVVNRAALSVLGLTEDAAVGTEFQLSFVATGELLSNKNEKLQSNPINYKIIGITPDDNSPVIYVPFIDLRALGINNFSQVKLSVNHESRLERVREHVENLGFNTRSVSDTVSQINSLFSTARVMLALLGTVALSIASLGMFNTLTVSLLERTREVGLMKAMGLKPAEVRELFLAESMIMGSLGGFLGLTSGFAIAKILEVLISIFTIVRGVGYVTIVNVPPLFALAIIFVSFFVGLLTGIFPARRSAKISALNALRYE